jgi:hypothetical protein
MIGALAFSPSIAILISFSSPESSTGAHSGLKTSPDETGPTGIRELRGPATITSGTNNVVDLLHILHHCGVDTTAEALVGGDRDNDVLGRIHICKIRETGHAGTRERGRIFMFWGK